MKIIGGRETKRERLTAFMLKRILFNSERLCREASDAPDRRAGRTVHETDCHGRVACTHPHSAVRAAVLD